MHNIAVKSYSLSGSLCSGISGSLYSGISGSLYSGISGSLYSGILSYLYKLTCSGGIPCYKPQGKHIYFNKQEIDQWLMQNKKATTRELDSQAATFVTLKSGAK
ncbi:MAG: helix-turn-helix domain-containing protein [Saprospiraceae bacterium]|nr:helix-turn-helix domain-containing protein [Saprospiraceae bacterium]